MSLGARRTTEVGGRGRNQDPGTGLTTTNPPMKTAEGSPSQEQEAVVETGQSPKTATRTAQNHRPNPRRENLTITPPSSTTFSGNFGFAID